MKLPGRNFLYLAAGAAALLSVSRLAWAQAYPTRPVHITVGFPPAGVGEIFARLMGAPLAGSPADFGKLIANENREMGQGDPGGHHQAGLNEPDIP
jgi:tripartite-type tricarboxylate transporter receptor subunit TctC